MNAYIYSCVDPDVLNTKRIFQRRIYVIKHNFWCHIFVFQGHCDKVGAFNNRNLWSSSSRESRSKIKVSASLVPSKGCERRICFRTLSLGCRWTSFLCVSSHCFPFSCVVSVSKFPLFLRTPVMLD